MFTVIIAQQEVIDSIEEYHIFLSPFTEKSKVKFCAWDTECTSDLLTDMVPDLIDTVGSVREWRALVICDERGLNRKNPFDLVEYQRPKRKIVPREKPNISELEPLEDYLARVQEQKFQAYDEARKQPLVRLMAYLCRMPIVSPMEEEEAPLNRGTNGIPAAHKENPPDYDDYRSESARREALEFQEYSAEGARREELLGGITGDTPLEIATPTEVLCIARRTWEVSEYEINQAWTPHLELQYSEFYDWNLYFDKMRYLIFDLLPRNNKNYTSDYIRFLYALLLLANHDIPSDSMQPNRVYCLNCENDDKALNHLMQQYDAKLAATAEMLSTRQHKLELKSKAHLTDREVEEIFFSNTAVPVVVSGNEADRSKFAVSVKPGLFTDTPDSEKYEWVRYYDTAKNELAHYLRQHPRALKRAAEDVHNLDQVDTERAPLLNSYQREDLAEHIGKEENAMVQVPTVNVGSAKDFLKKTDQANAAVQREIETRMTQHTALLLGGIALALMLLGFVPMLVGQIRNSAGNVLISIGIMLISLLGLGVVGFGCLWVLRSKLQARYRWFDRKMAEVVEEVDNALSLFSEYLSHACNVMRGFSVLNYCNEFEDPDTTQIHILKKHILDIQAARANLRESYGGFLGVQSREPDEQVTAYDYNFERAVDFSYPPPYTEAMKCEIEFMQPGTNIQIPVNFIKAITVKREELYD